MNWLAVDAAMNACGVAVQRADGTLFQDIQFMERGQSERLMPMILEQAQKAGLTLHDIDAYAVTTGPGTFTGLRVGLATIRALAQVSGKPVVGVGTFDALGASFERDVCILIETKRTDFYVRAPGHPDACMSGAALKAIMKPDWLLVGDAVHRAVSEQGFTNSIQETKSVPMDRLIMCAKRMNAGVMPSPVYLRGADVSVSKRQNAQIV